MPITIDIPPAVVQEIRDYEKSTGRSVSSMFVDFVEREVRRARETADWMARLDRLVLESSSRLPGPEPYRFNRADAYPEDVFA
ncbi:MAG: hypothetical protein IJ783_05285 [Kiritimatiellae bacterium]|nr:hypothetical protein [Kiritimatiellia bacterium]